MNQHDLHQFDLRTEVAARFIDSVQLQPEELVYEVGPGTGSLTSAILQSDAHVFAVEFDQQRAAALREKFAQQMSSGQLQLLCGDARQLLPPPPSSRVSWRIIANPPFMHTADFLRQWLLEDLPAGPAQRIDLVLQRQAAEKWCGERAMHTRSSILAHLFGVPSSPQALRREDVEPPSHVDLCTWSLVRHPDAASAAELRCVDTLLQIAFAGSHRMADAVRKITTPAILKKQARMHHWRVDDHPRSLSPAAWLSLASFLRSIQKI